MKTVTDLSRRDFVKTAALAPVIGMAGFSSCRTKETRAGDCPEKLPYFDQKIIRKNGITGLLYSQIGYETDFPVRIILRFPERSMAGDTTFCRLKACNKDLTIRTEVRYWGEKWGSHWWIAEFGPIREETTWILEIVDHENILAQDYYLETGQNILWKKTFPFASVDMLERRKHFTKVGAGWQDAGTLWVESCSQSAMIIALEEMLLFKNNEFEKDFLERIFEQITVGCDYLVMLHNKAKELGFPVGAMSHDLHGHEKDILPSDAYKAVIALMRASRLLPDSYTSKIEIYYEIASSTFEWLLNEAKPLGKYGFSYEQRGLSGEVQIPGDEFQTRDLVLMCYAAIEKWKTDGGNAKEVAVNYARRIIDRQVTKENAEAGYYGHFYEYDSLKHSEKSWSHCITGNQFGADLGGFYPNYLIPLVDMFKLWPDNPDAPEWKRCLEHFTYGYLIPACQENPFQIVPLGIFGKEGVIWFAGPFHGTNTIYGYTAALALELEKIFDEPKLTSIAYSNLQWLAGLNAGITRDSLKASVVFSTDVPSGVALPVSMMCGIGNRSAGSWFATRGVICNGFSTGEQFKMDTEPIRKNDAPESFTDEDWIPHSAAWLTGVLRL